MLKAHPIFHLSDPALHRQLIEQFGRAVRQGGIDEVVQLLTRDATLNVDSGGAIRAAARQQLSGALRVAQFLTGVTRKMAPAQMLVHLLDINGEPALVTSVDGVPQQVATVSILDGRIQNINIMANPAKLRRVAERLATLSDAGELRLVWPSDS
jgi:RNA polymerase sigma-70 factor (ECF subfamily)